LRFADELLAALQAEIVNNHANHPVVSGCEGFRKVRMAVPGRGRRGGARVYYADIPSVGFVILGVIFLKNEKEDLSALEKSMLLEEYHQHLEIWGIDNE
jgi:hypothetical protein